MAPPPVVIAPPPPEATVVVIAPPAPPPAPPVGLVPTGSFFGRYEVRANYDKDGVSRLRFTEGDAFFYRARLGLATTPIEVTPGTNVVFQFTPQAAGVLGTLANTVTDAALGLHEGYLRVATSSFRYDIGRFEMNYGDALVIGDLGWNETGRSFDGMRARVSPNGPTGYYVDVFGTQIDEGRPDVIAPFAGGDQYLLGLYAGIGPAITTGLELDLYLLGQIWSTAENAPITAGMPAGGVYERESAGEATFGIRAKQKIGSFDYRAEAGLQAGKRAGVFPAMLMMGATPPTDIPSVKSFAYQIDAEVGAWALEDKLRVGLEGAIASGDDPTTADKNEGWNELYPTAHKFLGLADIFHQGGQKRTNVMTGVLHVTAKPTADFALQLDGHIFTRPEGPGDNSFAGAEIDTGLAYTIGKGLVAKAMYAVFVPDAELYPQGPTAATADEELAHYLELELRYDLK